MVGDFGDSGDKDMCNGFFAYFRHIEDVDTAAIRYLHTLLSDVSQMQISHALRSYKGSEFDRVKDFNAILKKKIDEKQAQYDMLMCNLSSGVLPTELVSDIGQQM